MFQRMMNRTIAAVALLLITITSALTQTVKVADVNAVLPHELPYFKLFGRAGLTKGEETGSTWFAGPPNTVSGVTRYFNGEVMDIRRVGSSLHIDLTGTTGTDSNRVPASLFLTFKDGKVSASGAWVFNDLTPQPGGRWIININAVSNTQSRLMKPGQSVRLAFVH